MEAIAHLRQGLALLQTLPETPQRLQREVDMHIALGASLRVDVKASLLPRLEQSTRLLGSSVNTWRSHQRFPVLRGLWNYYLVRAELQTAHALGEQLLSLAQQAQDSGMLVAAHRALGTTLGNLGAVADALTHYTQGIALYDLQQHGAAAFLDGAILACCAIALPL